MLLYNVTVTVDQDIHEDWLCWMRDVHIPEVIVTGMFVSCRMSRLLNHEHEGAEIYSMQYLAHDLAHLQQYMAAFAPALQRAHQERYEGKYAAFRTVMEVVEEFGASPSV